MDIFNPKSVTKTQPTPSSVHVNRPLGNISIAYRQNQNAFIARRVFPQISVTKQSDAYYTYDRGHFNRDEMAKRAPGAEASGGGFEVSTDTYTADVYAYKHDIPDQRRENTDSPLMPDREATELVTLKALLQEEVLWASNYFAQSVWTNDVEGVSGTPSGAQVKQWNDAASTPIEDIRAYRTTVQQLTGFRPNTLVIGQEVEDKLYDHPDIVDRVKYGQTPGRPADITTQDLANLFKVDRVMTMASIQNTAAEGAANAHAFIGGKGALLCYSAPNPGLMTPSGGYTFNWTGMTGGVNGTRIKKYRLENIESDRVEIQSAYAQKLVSADLGVFFRTIVA
jgi:hypothetical protein